MTPKNPLYSDTGRTLRNGCKTAPAERSRNASAMVGIKSSIRRTSRTSSSLSTIGQFCIGLIGVLLDKLAEPVIPSASLIIIPEETRCLDYTRHDKKVTFDFQIPFRHAVRRKSLFRFLASMIAGKKKFYFNRSREISILIFSRALRRSWRVALR